MGSSISLCIVCVCVTLGVFYMPIYHLYLLFDEMSLSCAHFLIGLFVSLSFEGSVYIPEKRPLQRCGSQVFGPSVWDQTFLFHSCSGVFHGAVVFHVDAIQLIRLPFMVRAVGGKSKNSLPSLDSKDFSYVFT